MTATKRNTIPKKLCINSLGEVLVGDRLVTGSVNITELQEKIGRKPTQKDIDREFRRSVKEKLGEKASRLVFKVWDLQNAVTDGRFRVYLYHGTKVVLSTEFNALTENEEAWKSIDAAAKALGVKTWVMHEMERMDRGTMDGIPYHGPEDGKMERQVSLDVPLRYLTAKHAKDVVRKVKRATEQAWKTSGVCVI